MEQTLLCFCHRVLLLERKKASRREEWTGRMAVVLMAARAAFPVLCLLRLFCLLGLRFSLQCIINEKGMKNKLKKIWSGWWTFQKVLGQDNARPDAAVSAQWKRDHHRISWVESDPLGSSSQLLNCLEDLQQNVQESKSLSIKIHCMEVCHISKGKINAVWNWNWREKCFQEFRKKISKLFLQRELFEQPFQHCQPFFYIWKKLQRKTGMEQAVQKMPIDLKHNGRVCCFDIHQIRFNPPLPPAGIWIIWGIWAQQTCFQLVSG